MATSSAAQAAEAESGGEAVRNACNAAAGWYLARTQPRREALAVSHLERQGWPTACPLIPAAQARRPGSGIVLKPFFPGYVFVKLNPERAVWRAVNGTIGVQHLVSFGGRPAETPHGLVEDLVHRTNPAGVLEFDEPLQVGDRVRVVGGAFDRFVGVVAQASEQDRILVLLDLMKRQCQVELPRSVLLREQNFS